MSAALSRDGNSEVLITHPQDISILTDLGNEKPVTGLLPKNNNTNYRGDLHVASNSRVPVYPPSSPNTRLSVDNSKLIKSKDFL